MRRRSNKAVMQSQIGSTSKTNQPPETTAMDQYATMSTQISAMNKAQL